MVRAEPLTISTLSDFGERIKYEDVYQKLYPTTKALFDGLTHYIHFYNHKRLHQSLNYAIPAEVYISAKSVSVTLNYLTYFLHHFGLDNGVHFTRWVGITITKRFEVVSRVASGRASSGNSELPQNSRNILDQKTGNQSIGPFSFLGSYC